MHCSVDRPSHNNRGTWLCAEMHCLHTHGTWQLDWLLQYSYTNWIHQHACSSQMSILLVHVPRLGMHGCLAIQLVGVLGLQSK